MKTQQGVPSQPLNFRIVETQATFIRLSWDRPAHSGENIVSYELYWNDTFERDVRKQSVRQIARFQSCDLSSRNLLENLLILDTSQNFYKLHYLVGDEHLT